MSLQDLLFKVPTIRKAWRAGHCQELIQDNVSLVDICEDLQKCIKKLSLKTSSTLIVGAARVYSAELDDLFNDIIKMNKEFTTRNKKRTYDEDKQSEAPTISFTSQPHSASEPTSTMQPMSTLHSASTTQSASPSEPTSLSESGSTTQPASTSTSQPGLASQACQASSSSKSVSSSEPGFKIQSESTSQPELAVQPRNTSQVRSTSQPRSTSQSEHTPQSGSTSQRISQLRSISQPKSTSPSGSTSQSSQPESTNQSLSSVESQKSERSTDHEGYFPLPSASPGQLIYEHSSDYEDVSPTYTRNSNRQEEYFRASTRSRFTLSTITEENSSFFRRADTSAFGTSADTPSENDPTLLSNQLQTKRSKSDIRGTEITPNSEDESRKRQNSDVSVDSSESGSFERTGRSNVTKERSEHDDVSVRITKRTIEDILTETYAIHERSPSAQSIILQSSNIRTSEDQLEPRKRQRTDTSEDESSRLQKTKTDETNEEISHIGSDFDKAFMRTTEASIKDTTMGERDNTPSEHSIILDSSNILKDKGLKRENRKKQDVQMSHKKNIENPLQTDVLESRQRVLLDAGTSPKIRHQETQISPLRFKVLESRPDHLEAGIVDARDKIDQGTQLSPLQSDILESGQHLDETSLGFRNVRDQGIQVSPRLPNVEEPGPPFEFDSSLPFVSVSLYGLCQCDRRVPCAIVYSSIMEE